MANYFYGRTALTGGGVTALDSIDGASLLNGDGALVMVPGAGVYFYILDEDSGLAETSPTVIAPDFNPSNKRWILQNLIQPGLSGMASGDMIYRGASSLERLVKGSAGQVVTMDSAGAYPVWAPPAGITGSYLLWPTETPPAGYFECDGSAYSSTAYPNLFAVIGYMYGGSSGTFNVPDARGYFPRFWDHGVGRDANRTTRTDRGDGTTGDHVGTKQAQSMGPTAPLDPYAVTASLVDATPIPVYPSGTGTPKYLTNMGAFFEDETRPENINIMLCIKY